MYAPDKLFFSGSLDVTVTPDIRKWRIKVWRWIYGSDGARGEGGGPLAPPAGSVSASVIQQHLAGAGEEAKMSRRPPVEYAYDKPSSKARPGSPGCLLSAKDKPAQCTC